MKIASEVVCARTVVPLYMGQVGTGQDIPFREDGAEIPYTEDGIPWFAGFGPKSFVPYMEVPFREVRLYLTSTTARVKGKPEKDQTNIFDLH